MADILLYSCETVARQVQACHPGSNLERIEIRGSAAWRLVIPDEPTKPAFKTPDYFFHGDGSGPED